MDNDNGGQWELQANSDLAYLKTAPFAAAILAGPDLLVVMANTRQLAIWDQDELTVIGKPLGAIREEAQTAELYNIIRGVMVNGSSVEGKQLKVSIIENGLPATRYYEVSLQRYNLNGSNTNAVVMISTDVTKLVKAEAEITFAKEQSDLAVSEWSRLRQLFDAVNDTTPDLVYLFNVNYRFIYANKALLNMWGCDWDYARGKSLLELGYQPWHAEMHEREIDEIITTKKSIRGEVSFPHATLGRRVYDYIFTPVFNESGEVEAVAGTTRDITDINKATAALAESERRFRDIADQSPMFVYILEPNDEGTVSYWNKTWLDYTGQDLAEALGRAWDGIIHPDDVAEVLRFYQPALKSRQPYLIPAVRVKRYDNIYRWHMFKASPRYVNGVFEGFAGVGFDIDEQKLAADALKESETRFRTLADEAPMFIFLADKNMELVYVNRETLKFVGLNHYADYTAQSWREFVHPDDIDHIAQRFIEAYSKHEGYELEARFKEASTGKYHWHLFKNIPRYEGNEFVGFVGTAINIQQQKELMYEIEARIVERTTQLAESNRKLESSNDDLQQFAHVASHDLKEPVRKIRIFTERLKEELGNALPAAASRYLSKIDVAASRMHLMIEGILTFASIEGAEKSNEPVQLSATLETIQTDLELLIAEKQAKIIIQQLPEVNGSAVLLYQLFYNLLSNSLKFAKPGVQPEIQVSSRIVDPGVLPVPPSGNTSNFYCITVKDNGIGFDQSQEKKIFQTFGRLFTKDKYEGTGLGLALCKKIVERHHGQIKAEGVPGVGTAINVYLPCEPVAKSLSSPH